MSISFCHIGGPSMASYRYRCLMPSKEIGAQINNPKADILIFSKPDRQDIPHAMKAKEEKRKVIVDVCDMHFDLDHYKVMIKLADEVVCPTEWFKEFLKEDFGVEAHVIGDPYEFPEVMPHCNGVNLLWFGHGINFSSLQRVGHQIMDFPLKIVSNIDGAIPYSFESLSREFSQADIVLMPETAPYKSANRTIEAIRQGCFVVAEPHPAINHFPIYIGNIRKGIEWANQNPQKANEMTAEAQSFIKKEYSPQTLGSAWRKVIRKAQSSFILDAGISDGLVGLALM